MKIIFDIGANQGQNLNYFLDKADVVVAFEANPDLVLNIKKKFKEFMIYTINNTIKNLKANKIRSINDIYELKMPIVCFSKKYLEIEKEIRFFLKSKMYNNKSVLIKNNAGKKIVKDLFLFMKENPNKFFTKNELKEDKFRVIADFISGMTDRFAIKLHKKIS